MTGARCTVTLGTAAIVRFCIAPLEMSALFYVRDWVDFFVCLTLGILCRY